MEREFCAERGSSLPTLGSLTPLGSNKSAGLSSRKKHNILRTVGIDKSDADNFKGPKDPLKCRPQLRNLDMPDSGPFT